MKNRWQRTLKMPQKTLKAPPKAKSTKVLKQEAQTQHQNLPTQKDFATKLFDLKTFLLAKAKSNLSQNFQRKPPQQKHSCFLPQN